METHFSSQFFAANREKLKSIFTGTAPIVITANGLVQRGGDTTYSFCQDANFWYLTGINEPDLVLVMDKGREYLIVPNRSTSREAFDGALDGEGLIKRSGISEVYDDKKGWEKLGARLKKVKHVATLASPGTYIESFGFYTNPARAAVTEKMKAYSEGIELLDLSHHLLRLRVVKQDAEIAALESAIDITDASLKEILSLSKRQKYAQEYELEAELTRAIRKRGADGHGFSPIVASGQNACTLHNVANNGQIKLGELIVVDCGAEVEHYSADITRTVVAGPNPNKRQQSVHAAVIDVQNYALSLIKPGILLRDYEKQIENYMGEKLRELNLIKTITSENVREFYPHATSHFLGLNVHDVGYYDEPLQLNSVITVEPGIYIKKESIGVRIEDDVLLTENGVKVLSSKLPSGLELS